MASDSSSSSVSPAPAQQPDRLAEPVSHEQPPRLPFPVVGVGASAGGLEAFSEFLKATPANIGMAFVLIQHLPPERESMIAAILSKLTPLPVHQVEDEMAVEVNHVYVIRPGRTLTIAGGRLHLSEPTEKRGHQRPVDDFFRSLAEEQRERAIAIVMSGMGSNGTAGAETVKAVGGLCIAQELESAGFPSMPRNLIDMGLADYVLKPEEMPEVLARFAAHPYVAGQGKERTDPEAPALKVILDVLKTRLRHDFSPYKKPTVIRRVQRRMGLAQLTSMQDYARMVRQHPGEAAALADDLMIHVTGFFRDPEVWEALNEKVVAPLIANKPEGGVVRAWVTACSSGEEAYTLAMLLVEAADVAKKDFDIKVFATDTAERSLGLARTGVYAGGIESEVSPERLQRFFDHDDSIYRVKKQLRDLVVFAPLNLLQDPPFSRLDICTCRNLLIYLEPEMQRRALLLMHFGLMEGGTLLLGSSETIGPLDDLFEAIDKKKRIYRRVGPTRYGAVDFPMPRLVGMSSEGEMASPFGGIPRQTLNHLVQKTLLTRYTPPSIVVDRQSRVVLFHGRTERFLAQPAGEPTREFLELVREPFRGAARTALHNATTQNTPATSRDRWIATEQGRTGVEVTVVPLGPEGNPGYFLVSFQEVTELNLGGNGGNGAPAPSSPRHDLEEELRRVTGELQSTIEELQTNNEEMKASAEEATSINEELQSTNEELETSKEELQSLNEELTTVNSQLQAKMEELECATNDMSSLLSSTHIAVVFLDTEFRIRRFTPAVKDLMELIPFDVGRPIKNLALKFEDPEFLTDIQRVLENLVPLEREVESASGRRYVRRTLPYRTGDNRIDGIVITFVDISGRHAAEAALRESEERYRLILDGVKEYAIFMLDVQGRFATWPTGAQRVLGYSSSEALGRPLSVLLTPEDRENGVAEREIVQATEEGSASEDRWHQRKDGTRFWGSGVLASLKGEDGHLRGFVKVLRDNTDLKMAEEALKQAKASAEEANAAKDYFLATVSHELRTPLAGMMLWTKLLEDLPETRTPKLREGLEAIRNCAEEQQQLIEDLLDTSRIVAGKMRLEPKPTNLVATLGSAADAVRPAVAAKNLSLVEQMEAEVGWVRADAHRLQQVVWNLLSNAVKFTPAGGTIRLAARRRGSEVEIEVSDSGIGIAPNFIESVFDRFGQAEQTSARESGGLGLGLAICKQLVELHGGHIRAESRGLGHGASFKVVLPLPVIDPATASTDSHSPLSARPNLNGLRVMLLEDMAATRKALTLILRGAGADVIAFDRAAEALAEFKTRRPDLILSDLGLPETDGHEFIRRIRAMEKELGGFVPAVALSAYGDENNRRRAEISGFQEYLAKPIDARRLMGTLLKLKPAPKA
jgi:two-component system, chemotaxis family, CheB/CheR fusion protein